MLKLRLQRRGKRNYATYRVVVAEQHAPVKGRFIADVGWYNPHTNEFNVDEAVVKEWLAKGVQPSDTVHNFLVTKGIIKGEKVTIWRPKKKEAAAEQKKEADQKEAQKPAEEKEAKTKETK
ncbi:MAG: 30S ribosomal protein S16 [bacterium]|nr:30S ribosomal protein S16 [bacterium]